MNATKKSIKSRWIECLPRSYYKSINIFSPFKKLSYKSNYPLYFHYFSEKLWKTDLDWLVPHQDRMVILHFLTGNILYYKTKYKIVFWWFFTIQKQSVVFHSTKSRMYFKWFCWKVITLFFFSFLKNATFLFTEKPFVINTIKKFYLVFAKIITKTIQCLVFENNICH